MKINRIKAAKILIIFASTLPLAGCIDPISLTLGTMVLIFTGAQCSEKVNQASIAAEELKKKKEKIAWLMEENLILQQKHAKLKNTNKNICISDLATLSGRPLKTFF